MCFNYSLAAFRKYLERRFNGEFDCDEYEPIYHVKADQNRLLPILCQDNPNKFKMFKWRLIPTWSKDLVDATKRREHTYNATCERIFEAPSFRNLIFKNRCIIPADGFYEWHLASDGKKYPFYIKLKSGDVFGFAGIFSNWLDKEANTIYNTFAIITVPANTLLEKIHNTKKRMPLILPYQNEKKWLNPKLTKDDIIKYFIPFTQEELIAYPVDKKSIIMGINNENVIKKVVYEELSGFD